MGSLPPTAWPLPGSRFATDASKPLSQVPSHGPKGGHLRGAPWAQSAGAGPGLGKRCKWDPLTIQRSHQTAGEGPSCAFGSPGEPAQGIRAWAPRSAGQRGRWSLASGRGCEGAYNGQGCPRPPSSLHSLQLCPAQQHCPLLVIRRKCTPCSRGANRAPRGPE